MRLDVPTAVSAILELYGYTNRLPMSEATQMTLRIRDVDKAAKDGRPGQPWSLYAAYLELKAYGIAVGYGLLSDGQLMAHRELGRPMIVAVAGPRAEAILGSESEIPKKRLRQWPVLYCLTTPGPRPTQPAGTVCQWQWGATPTFRGRWAANVDVPVRRSPYVREDPPNVARRLKAGAVFDVAQSTYAGTNVGGVTLWLGNEHGTEWVFGGSMHVVPRGG